MNADRTSGPSAHKRPKATAPLDAAERALRRLLSPGSPARPAFEYAGDVRTGGGIERPVPEWHSVAQSLDRTFAFVDICGFTSHTEREGAHAAIDLLTRFRWAVRDVTARRGVRVAKWLGDGAMLVGVESGPTIAAAAELVLRFEDDNFDVHGGVSAGQVLLFEGDDYIGASVNLAARLCEAAGPGELLAHGVDDDLPEWVEPVARITVRAHGIGDIGDVLQLRVGPDAWAITVPEPDLDPTSELPAIGVLMADDAPTTPLPPATAPPLPPPPVVAPDGRGATATTATTAPKVESVAEARTDPGIRPGPGPGRDGMARASNDPAAMT